MHAITAADGNSLPSAAGGGTSERDHADRTIAPLASFLAGLAAAGSDNRGNMLDKVRQKAGAITSPESDSAA